MSAFAVLALLTLPAMGADERFCRPSSVPPVEFRGEPTQKYKIVEWPEELLAPLCTNGGLKWTPDGLFGGCAIVDAEDPAYAFIYILAGLSEGQRECVLVHEKAHLNGWMHGPAWASYQSGDGTFRPAPGPRFRRIRH